jgi:hypothetical protein
MGTIPTVGIPKNQLKELIDMKARIYTAIVVSILAGITIGAAATLAVTPSASDVDLGSGHSAGQSISVQPAGTLVPCAEWKNSDVTPYDDYCGNEQGKKVAVFTDDTVDCNNDSYNAAGESEELTLLSVTYSEFCK